jgi:glutathione reductase (NADPH)
MENYDFDLFVIGAGSGGVRASRIAGRAGAKVAICEESRVGGTCVIRGCIPKKILVYASHYGPDFDDARNFGWTVEKRFDWPTLIQNKNKEIDRLNGVYKNLLSGAGVKLFESKGRLLDAHTVQVGDEKYTAKTILIAVGGWPHFPEIPGIEHAISSNEALELPELPKRAVIVGGGYIGLEFANIFHGCGSDVTIIIRSELVLNGFDKDVQLTVVDELKKQGIKIINHANVKRLDKLDSGAILCHLDKGGDPIETDVVLFATGRRPNTAGLGLENAGVKLDDDGAIVVDGWSKTSVDNIYAVGDVTDRIQLTPVALAEGHAFADTLYNNNARKCDHTNVPSAVFTEPPVAFVGLTEENARKNHQIDVYVSRFTPLKHTISKRDQKTFMKLIVEKDTDRVLGAHMVGADAPEIMQGVAIAIKCGATKAQFDQTIGIHPSAAEEFVTMRTKRDN